LSELIKETSSQNSIETEDTCNNKDVLSHLQEVIELYLSDHTNLTINSLSQRCGVSEPTLRRIQSNQVKTIPNDTTILKILSYISKKTNIAEIVDFFPGPLKDFLRSKVVPSHTQKTQFLEASIDLSNRLKDSVKYLIYKLSSNAGGVTEEKVSELFGQYGVQKLEELANEELVLYRDDKFVAKYENYRLSDERCVDNFKATAGFIKPNKLNTAPYESSQIFCNVSGAVSLKVYQEILKIKRKAVKKIRDIIFDVESEGAIPVFILGAVDTLDNKSAFEIENDINN